MGMHKCENCGLEITWKTRAERGKVANGWTGSLQSRYGKTYDKRSGGAWWCPSVACQRAKEATVLKRLFPTLSNKERERLLVEGELWKLREN